MRQTTKTSASGKGKTSQTAGKTRTTSTNSTTRTTSTSGSTRSTASSSKITGTQATSVYNDKQILQDTLMSQKHITDAYNTFAGECVSAQLRNTMLNILNDEHAIQATIFNSMQSNGWYKTEPATTKSIQKAKQKASSN